LTGEILLFLRFLVALSLFIFLGWVIWVFWREYQTNAALLASRRVPPLALQIARPAHELREQTLTQAETVIGRDPTCEVLLEDEVVSAHHARLSYHHSQWWLEDLHSTNGTKLNGEPILTPTVVIPGDVITCGDVDLTLAIPGKSGNIPTVEMQPETGAPVD
jgi:pSer/pThr/pTyr-binding forkhead associated (FHA) protein